MEIGTHEFTFQFKTPDNLPPSFFSFGSEDMEIKSFYNLRLVVEEI
jgi:hypothetical protein